MLLAVGLLLLKLGVLNPLEQARAGASELQTFAAAALLAPLCLLLGLSWLLLPPRAVWNLLTHPSLYDARRKKPTTAGHVLLVAVLTPGLLVYGWLRWQLGLLGYN